MSASSISATMSFSTGNTGRMDGGDETSLINVINNCYNNPGPATRPGHAKHDCAASNSGNVFRGDSGKWPLVSDAHRPGKWYVAGNFFDGHPEIGADNWQGHARARELGRVNTPFEGWPVNRSPHSKLLESVLAKGSATVGPRRDAVDRRVPDDGPHRKVTAGDASLMTRKKSAVTRIYFLADQVPADSDH